MASLNTLSGGSAIPADHQYSAQPVDRQATDCQVKAAQSQACGEQDPASCKTSVQTVALVVSAGGTTWTIELKPEQAFRIHGMIVRVLDTLTPGNYGTISVRTNASDRVSAADTGVFNGSANSPAMEFAVPADNPIKLTVEHAVAEATAAITYLITFSGTVPS